MGSQESQVEDQRPDNGCAEPEASADGMILTWKVHLLRDNPKKMLPIIPVPILSILICYAIFHSVFYMMVVAALFIIALSDFLFPIRYEITNRDAASFALFSRSRIEWAAVKKYYIDDSGIKLSPFENRSRLESYRGVYLRFGHCRDEVTAVVRRMRDEHRES